MNEYNKWVVKTYGDAVFEPKCPKCGLFVRADKSITINGLDEVVKGKNNATCSKCGRVEMNFIGYF